MPLTYKLEVKNIILSLIAKENRIIKLKNSLLPVMNRFFFMPDLHSEQLSYIFWEISVEVIIWKYINLFIIGYCDLKETMILSLCKSFSLLKNSIRSSTHNNYRNVLFTERPLFENICSIYQKWCLKSSLSCLNIIVQKYTDKVFT